MDCFFIRLLRKKKVSQLRPNNPDYRLDCGELLELFAPLRAFF
ncbi:MAG: hypothetical protein WCS87_01355 [Methylococcaceae bacterium]